MDSKNQKDSGNQKEWLSSKRITNHYDMCDIYTTLDKYKFIINNMEKKGWIWFNQGVIQDTLIEIKLFEQTGCRYTIRITFTKPIDNYEEEVEMERDRILAWRKGSFIYNQ